MDPYLELIPSHIIKGSDDDKMGYIYGNLRLLTGKIVRAAGYDDEEKRIRLIGAAAENPGGAYDISNTEALLALAMRSSLLEIMDMILNHIPYCVFEKEIRRIFEVIFYAEESPGKEVLSKIIDGVLLLCSVIMGRTEIDERNTAVIHGKFTAASLFCGAGGLDIGFEKAGFETIWANDWDVDSCATFKRWNKKALVVCGDVNHIATSMIPDVDVLLGGFPCQGFSLSGPRKLDDKRNVLYQQYVRIVKGKQPLMFVGENVKGLLSMGGGQIIEAIVEEFSQAGYDVHYKLLNASDYGVPEDRERVIICGFRKDLGITDFEYPEPLRHKTTIREALAGIDEPGEVCTAPYSSRYMSRNRRRGWDDVSFTIPAMAKQCPLWPGSPEMVKIDSEHWKFGEGETRRFSWREAAAIQTFPDGMKFDGDITSIYKQIGNAVPAKLAEAVARHLMPILTEAVEDKL